MISVGVGRRFQGRPEQCCSAIQQRRTADTSVDIDSFSVTGTYDDGSTDNIEGCVVTNPGELVGEQATTFTIDCGGVAVNVEVTGVTPVPVEYQNALVKANQYSDMMHMSKQGIYDQLVSEYGEQFTPDAAQWAIDHMTADWNANALQKAKDYQDMMAMSPAAIYNQLISSSAHQLISSSAHQRIRGEIHSRGSAVRHRPSERLIITSTKTNATALLQVPWRLLFR